MEHHHALMPKSSSPIDASDMTHHSSKRALVGILQLDYACGGHFRWGFPRCRIQSRKMADCFPLPNELLLISLKYLNGEDVRAFGNTCRRFRNFIIANKSQLPIPKITWEAAHFVFGRRVIITRFNESPLSPKGRKRRYQADRQKDAEWAYTEEEFSTLFTKFFFLLTPQVLYIKCKDFDKDTEGLIRKCVGVLWGKTLALEMDKCSVDEHALGDFFKYFSPFYLHLAGHFDRSIICDQILPLSTLFALFVGVNRADTETRTRISGITVRKIVNNWFKRYPENCDVESRLRDIDDYHRKSFLIEIPDCDLDYNEFFAFLRELILIPHPTKERVRLGRLPKTLIHTIHRNLSTFNEIGPSVWVQQGICRVEDTKWSSSVSCQCTDGRRTDHNYFLDENLFADPSEMCDTVQLDLSITVSKFEEMLKPKKTLLDVWLTLKASLMELEKCVPTLVTLDSMSSKRKKTGI